MSNEKSKEFKTPLAFRFQRADNTQEESLSTGNHAGTTFGT